MIVILPRRLSPSSTRRRSRHDGRVLRLAGLEDLGDARQTAGDVLRSGHLSRLSGEQGARRIRAPSPTSMRAFSGR
jgi:hypothetical protein